MTEYRQKLISILDQIVTDVDNKLTDDKTFYERNGWDYPLVNRDLIKSLILDFRTYLLDTDFINSEDFEKTLETLSRFWESWRISPFQHIAKIKEATSAATHHLLEHCNICALFPKAAAKPDEVALASAR